MRAPETGLEAAVEDLGVEVDFAGLLDCPGLGLTRTCSTQHTSPLPGLESGAAGQSQKH